MRLLKQQKLQNYMNNGAFGKRGVIMGQKLKNASQQNTPGSGAYSPDYTPVKNTLPRFSMGIKLHPELQKLKVPGPGAYANKAQNLKASAPSFGFGTSKRQDLSDLKKSSTPGPGNYKLPRHISNAPDFSLPGKTEE